MSLNVVDEKVVWFLWFQGLEAAPEIIQLCHRSWVERCGWDVVVLNESNLAEYAMLDHKGVVARQSPNHRADLLRLDLLANHGGVWVDATCFCLRPLDYWLPGVMGSGFFAFGSPGPDRPLCSWFIASAKSHLLATRMLEKMYPYWSCHPFRQSPRLEARMGRILNRTPTSRALWFSKPMRDWARIAPYFAFHYGFEHLVRTDPESAAAWRAVPEVDGPHGLWERGIHVPPSDELRAAIDERRVPLFKTSWKFDGPIVPGSSLAYLVQTLQS
jgi:hypothetical protein